MAEAELARKYQKGDGVEKDYAKAAEHAKIAAEHGDAKGQCLYGLILYFGEGASSDPTGAVTWFLKAANQGDIGAAYLLFDAYHKGKGVVKNDAEAAKWCLRAASAGLSDAQYSMAVLYSNGIGVKKDSDASVDWLMKAAKQGNPKAIKLQEMVFGSESRVDHAAKLGGLGISIHQLASKLARSGVTFSKSGTKDGLDVWEGTDTGYLAISAYCKEDNIILAMVGATNIDTDNSAGLISLALAFSALMKDASSGGQVVNRLLNFQNSSATSTEERIGGRKVIFASTEGNKRSVNASILPD